MKWIVYDLGMEKYTRYVTSVAIHIPNVYWETGHTHTVYTRPFLAEKGLGKRLGKIFIGAYKNQTYVVTSVIILLPNWPTHAQYDRLVSVYTLT